MQTTDGHIHDPNRHMGTPFQNHIQDSSLNIGIQVIGGTFIVTADEYFTWN
jgi:hypothetical protein